LLDYFIEMIEELLLERALLFTGVKPKFVCSSIFICLKMVEESCQKEWYRQMFLALQKLTGESVIVDCALIDDDNG